MATNVIDKRLISTIYEEHFLNAQTIQLKTGQNKLQVFFRRNNGR